MNYNLKNKYFANFPLNLAESFQNFHRAKARFLIQYNSNYNAHISLMEMINHHNRNKQIFPGKKLIYIIDSEFKIKCFSDSGAAVSVISPSRNKKINGTINTLFQHVNFSKFKPIAICRLSLTLDFISTTGPF